MSSKVLRFELKYPITLREIVLLRSKLSKVMAPDPNSSGQQGGYFIRSLYFDTPFNAAFREKTGGFEYRKKFRLRVYEFPHKVIKFETKSKLNDMILKDSSSIYAKDLPELMRGRYDCLLNYKDEHLHRIYAEFKKLSYRPVVVVDYFREAFMLNFNQIRITLDSRLKKSNNIAGFSDQNLMTIPVLPMHFSVLEVKYNRFFPGWLKGLLSGFPLQRTANSKYCLSRIV